MDSYSISDIACCMTTFNVALVISFDISFIIYFPQSNSTMNFDDSSSISGKDVVPGLDLNDLDNFCMSAAPQV